MTYQRDQRDHLVAERDRVADMQEHEDREWAQIVLKNRLKELETDIRHAETELDQ